MTVDLPAFSMNAKTPVYDVGVLVFGLRRTVVAADATDLVYKVPQNGEGRLDLLSDAFYGTSLLWWVIADANSITDPISAPKQGDIIRVPTRERISREGLLNS